MEYSIKDLRLAMDIRNQFNWMDSNDFLDMVALEQNIIISAEVRKDWIYTGLNNTDFLNFRYDERIKNG